MAWIAVEKSGSIWLFEKKPERHQEITELSIEQLIGRTITWEDEPIELTEKI